MKPFDKDIFSDFYPQWTECNKIKANVIINLLKCNLHDYSHNTTIFQVGGLEINSNNFKIISNDSNKSIVLKKWSKDIPFDKINFHNEILTFLNKENVPSPKLIFFDNGLDYINYEGEYWTSQSFQDGFFFDGNVELSKSLINQVINLHSSLTKFHLENSHHQIEEIEYDTQIIETLKNNSLNFDLYFEPKYSELLKENWDLITTELNLSNKVLLKYPKKELCHIDLHPHNILVNKTNVVSFLDFDSVKLINRPIAIAYFALKTCKQICSLKNTDPIVLGKSIKLQLSQISPEMKSASEDLSYLVNSEVIRRICLILKLNIEKNNNLWNHILPILIYHLTESKMLFRH